VTAVADRLAARTEALVRIPSESRHEETILEDIRRHLPAAYRVVEDQDSVLLALPERTTAHVNFRYAPTQTPAEADRRLRKLLGPGSSTVETVGNAPPGPVPDGNPLVERLRAAGDLDVGPKQAWTPVAEFGSAGIDAVNFGPGDPQYAHRDDERVDVASLVRSYEVLRAFLEDAPSGRQG
jgi:acetylornithine deacetylase/succinyl-diaminopimelate desuccinylase-like protein